MKNQILQALKNKFGNLGFDEKALDGVATFAEKTITEEGQIANFVENAESMLNAFNAEADRRSSKATNDLNQMKTEFDAYKVANPEKTPGNDTPPPADGTLTPEVVQKMINDAVTANQKENDDRFTNLQTEKTQAQIRKDAMADLKENPLYKNEVNATLMENEFNNTTGNFETKEDLLKAVEDRYNPLIAKIGVKTPPPSGDGAGSSTEQDEQLGKFRSQQRKVRGQEDVKAD